ncbi:Phosphoglycolate phosphatase [Xylophilus ampelinus]|nr:HAD-IA family hydrolase [Variovorax sp.]VTY33007.1 Phosphoglycolate phosphatase [Xylophilus ampelinus]
MNVVFDLGAVLIGWEPARLVRAHFPQQAVDDASAAALARSFFHHEDWLAFDCGIRSVDEVVSRSAARLGLAAEAVHGLVAPLGERLEPIAENIALLHGLRERRDAGGPLRLFYLSNMPQPYARALERRFEFFRWFDGGIFSGDVKRVKPHEEIFNLLAFRHSLVPAQTLFIDDSVPNVETARALGWQALHCANPLALAPQLLRQLGPVA